MPLKPASHTEIICWDHTISNFVLAWCKWCTFNGTHQLLVAGSYFFSQFLCHLPQNNNKRQIRLIHNSRIALSGRALCPMSCLQTKGVKLLPSRPMLHVCLASPDFIVYTLYIHELYKTTKSVNVSNTVHTAELWQFNVRYSSNINEPCCAPQPTFPQGCYANWILFLRYPTNTDIWNEGKKQIMKVILPVKLWEHMHLYCGGDVGWPVVIHVAPFKHLFGFIRQASPTYWQNSPIHPAAQTHCSKTAAYSAV